MNTERWEKIRGLFDAALDLPPAKRERFLDNVCGRDDKLRREIESLLASSDDASSFMEQPAISKVADVIESSRKNIETGRCFGHYEIVRQIGAGGMGEVYLAQDKKLDRKVAIKILNEQFSKHNSNLGRFMREAKAVSALNHPNIIVIHEIGESSEVNYIVSEYIEGKTLRDIIEESRFSLPQMLDIAGQIAGALTAAHEAHIVHRDIKPENIIVRPDGYAKVLDFGLAKLIEQNAVGFENSTVKQNETAKGIILGTVNYMSPEQAKGEPIDEGTDIFSLGAVVYEMIAGRTPFAGDSMTETLANLINGEPPPLTRFSANVPDELQRIVSKMLRKNKDERYKAMKLLLADLKKLQKRLEFESELKVNDPPDTKTRTRQLKVKEEDTSRQTKNSIAVLPFKNMSADAENEYFCDGLAEELLNALAKLKNLKVAARTSAFSFKDKNVEISEIGNVLKVKTILEGSVRKAGNRLRISVQLIDAASGFHLWSERYDGELEDIFDLQDEITLAVIDELKVKLLSGEKAAIRNRYDENVEAYQLYLKGRYQWNKRTGESLKQSVEYYRQAIEKDPNFALAFSGLAETYVLFPSYDVAPADDSMPLAKAAALRALEIDDSLAEAHTALGYYLMHYEFDLDRSEKEFRRAIELKPDYATAHQWFAANLMVVKRFDESLAELRLAEQLEPLSTDVGKDRGAALVFARRYDEAIVQLKRTLVRDPNSSETYSYLGWAYGSMGMYAEAIAEARTALKLNNTFFIKGYLALWLGKSGNRVEAMKILTELKKAASEGYVRPSTLAVVYIGLGDKEEALKQLEKEVSSRTFNAIYLAVLPDVDELRSEPRFKAMLKRMNLPE